jgi:hypothetical protein
MGATSAGQVTTSLVLQDAQYIKALQNAQGSLSGFAKTTSTTVSQMGQDFARLAGSVVGVTAAFQTIKKVISEGIGFNKFMQEQQAAFTVMMKSADGAKAKIKELFDFAVDSPLTFKETVSASKQLLAYGFGAETLVDNMKMLGTVAKATGKSLDDISYVYGTLKTQGRAYTRDLMQFAMRGIPIYEELAKVLNVDVKQVQKLTETGKVGFAEVEQAFKNITGEGGRFFGMMDEYMKTLPGQMSMLGDIMQQTAGNFTQGITDELIPAIKQLIAFLQTNQEAIKSFGMVAGQVFKGLVDAVNVLIRAFEALWPVLILGAGYWVMVSAPAILLSLQGILATVWAIAAAFLATPIGQVLAVVAVVALGASVAFEWLQKRIKAAGDASREASKELEKFNNIAEIMDEKSARRSRTRAAATIIPPTDEMLKYMDKLRAEYAKFLAEKQRDDEYVADAVIQYERTVKIQEAKELFGASGPLFAEAKKYINAMADYESKALRDAQTKAWEDSLRTYQNQYAKVMAGRVKESAEYTKQEAGLYAIVDLEHKLDQMALEEKFKGNEAMKNQALDILEKLHQITMDNIHEEYAARELAAATDATLASAEAHRTMLAGPAEVAGRLDMSSFEGMQGSVGDIFATSADAIKKQEQLQRQITEIRQREADAAMEALRLRKEQTQAELASLGEEMQRMEQSMVYGQTAFADNTAALTELYAKRKAIEDNIAGLTETANDQSLEGIDPVMVTGLILELQAAIPELTSQIEYLTTDAELLATGIEFANEEYKRAADRKKQIEDQIGTMGYTEDEMVLEGVSTEAQKLQGELDVVNGVLRKYGDSLRELAFAQELLAAKLKREANIKLYKTQIEGDPEKFNDLRASIAEALEEGGLRNIFKAFMDTIRLSNEGTKAGAKASGANPMAMALNDMMKFIQGLGGTAGILKGILKGLGSAFKSVVGWVINFIMASEEVTKVIEIIMISVTQALQPAMESIAEGLTWLYDSVVVPLGNGIIRVINAIFKWVNDTFGAHLRMLNELQTTSVILAEIAAREALNALLERQKDQLSQTISYLTNKLNEMVDAQIQSLQDLYEVGAISGAQYQTMAQDAEKMRPNYDEQLVSLADLQLTEMENIYERLDQLRTLEIAVTEGSMTPAEMSQALKDAGITGTITNTAYSTTYADTYNNTYNTTYNTTNPVAEWTPPPPTYPPTQHPIALPRKSVAYATGTTNLPWDQTALIHAGEAIIPKTFADGIRAGEMILAGGNSGSAGDSAVYVTVNVAGSVSAENDLASSIAKNIYTQRKRGLLTV